MNVQSVPKIFDTIAKSNTGRQFPITSGSPDLRISTMSEVKLELNRMVSERSSPEHTISK